MGKKSWTPSYIISTAILTNKCYKKVKLSKPELVIGHKWYAWFLFACLNIANLRGKKIWKSSYTIIATTYTSKFPYQFFFNGQPWLISCIKHLGNYILRSVLMTFWTAHQKTKWRSKIRKLFREIRNMWKFFVKFSTQSGAQNSSSEKLR